MSDHEQPSPDGGRKLGKIFVNVTGETAITDLQDQEQEMGKKVINDTDSGSPQGEK